MNSILPTTAVVAMLMFPPVPVTNAPLGSSARQFPGCQPAGTTIVFTGLTVPLTTKYVPVGVMEVAELTVLPVIDTPTDGEVWTHCPAVVTPRQSQSVPV